MSNYKRSLALKENREDEVKLEDLLQVRHLSQSNVSPVTQPENKVVKVCGNITISF